MNVRSTAYEDFVEHDFERYVGWHVRALEQPPHQYEVCVDALRSALPPAGPVDLLNLCAANGNLLVHLHAAFAAWRLTGVDTVERLVEHPSSSVARELGATLETRPAEEWADAYGGRFDAVVHWMRLLHFADWRVHLRAAVAACRPGGHVLVSSLFNDLDVDLEAIVLDHSIAASEQGYAIRYDTISSREAERFLDSLGVTSASFSDIELPFDLERPAGGVGSYTVRAADGKRILLSAGLRMNWRLLHVTV